jgi:hypothetical protein
MHSGTPIPRHLILLQDVLLDFTLQPSRGMTLEDTKALAISRDKTGMLSKKQI